MSALKVTSKFMTIILWRPKNNFNTRCVSNHYGTFVNFEALVVADVD